MGCVVNGPGESKHADIGISLPGTFEEPVAPVFIDGKLDRTLRGDGLVAEFIEHPRGLRRAALSEPVGESPDRQDAPVRARLTAQRPPFEPSTRPGVYSAATERPLRDVGDPHVFFSDRP